MAIPKFRKQVIGRLENSRGPGEMNTLGCMGDFNADGYMDYAVCGRNGEMAWFENMHGTGEWHRHRIDLADQLECGGCVIDLTGNGFPDIINGSEGGNDAIYWWENTGRFDTDWTKRIIARTGHGQIHDTLICDLKGDGRSWLVFTNQSGGARLFAVPLPSDPRVSPWPELEVVAEDKWLPNEKNPWDPSGHQPEEGLAFGDLDGDGKGELVFGTHWYKWNADGWQCNRYTDRYYITTKIAIGDVDGDGRNEIVLSEGDAFIYGMKEGGKLAWFKPGDDVHGLWREHLVETGLLDGHSLHLADLCGNGHLDIFVGEIGAADWKTGTYIIREPRLMVYENDGSGRFPTRHILDEGTGTHEAALCDLRKDGRLCIVGKPLHGPEKWNIHAWWRE